MDGKVTFIKDQTDNAMSLNTQTVLLLQVVTVLLCYK